MLTLQAKQRKGGDGGRLAESLLSKPVRPAWGKGFCGGGFCRHLWELMESGLLEDRAGQSVLQVRGVP